MDVESLYNLLDNDLAEVRSLIKTTLLETKTDETEPVLQYLLKSQGKLIRPILVLLSTHVLDFNLNAEQKQKLVLVAAAIELIHMASLVHDDVIDNADSRRDMASIKAKFGNVTAVTMGVYLYSVALKLIAKTGSIVILDELSSTVKIMCEGELKQQHFIDSSSLNIESYFDIIHSKTAVLFKSASLVGSLLFDEENTYKSQLVQFSSSLGYVFQLTDDFLDIMATEDELKKSVGQDFLKGQFTLPMIYALEKMTIQEKETVFDCIKNKDLVGLELIKSVFSDNNLDELFNELIQGYITESITAINKLPQNQFNQALLFLVDYLKARVITI
jgi:geranylgeranyl pyrophosphate synthase